MDLLILNIAFNYYYRNLFILEIARSIPVLHFTTPYTKTSNTAKQVLDVYT